MWSMLLGSAALVGAYSYYEEVIIEGNRSFMVRVLLPIAVIIVSILTVLFMIFGWR